MTLIVPKERPGVKSWKHAIMPTNLDVPANLREHHPNQITVLHRKQQHLHPKQRQHKNPQASPYSSHQKIVFSFEEENRFLFIGFEHFQNLHATKTKTRTRTKKLRRKHNQPPQLQHQNHHQMMVFADKKVLSAMRKTAISSIVALTMEKAV